MSSKIDRLALGLFKTLGLKVETDWELETWEVIAEFLFVLMNEYLSRLLSEDP